MRSLVAAFLLSLVACGSPAKPAPTPPVSNTVTPPVTAPSPAPVPTEFVATHCESADEECMIRNFTGFTEQICRCPEHDLACANKVTTALTKWGEEMAKTSTGNVKPSEAAMKRMVDVSTRMTECMTKVMTPAADGAGSATP